MVATPIGNLGDITLRALDVLKQVDVVAAEDTRKTKQLLQHFSIQKPIFSVHEFNEEKQAQALLERLQSGQSIALVSDAGTPLISDPGYQTVHLLREKGMRVVPIPGACALIAALCVAGLPTHSFSFIGFLPPKSSARKRVFEAWRAHTETLVCYESPHRIMDCLEDIQACLGDRQIALGRELTKRFETIHTGTALEIRLGLEATPEQQQGEFVVLISGNEAPVDQASDECTISIDAALQSLVEIMPLKQAAKLMSEWSGHSKNELYERALRLRRS